VLRGGAWKLGHDYMRASRRHRYDRDVRYYLHGFRVIKTL
jgi:formylglycine-generating enzyme required for sulfatase activity